MKKSKQTKLRAVVGVGNYKGGVGKTTSSVNIVGEMKSDTVDLDTHTGLSIILGLRPEGKEISVKVPKTVDELIEIMTPYKNSDKTLLIDCGGFDSDLTRTAIAFAEKECVSVHCNDLTLPCLPSFLAFTIRSCSFLTSRSHFFQSMDFHANS